MDAFKRSCIDAPPELILGLAELGLSSSAMPVEERPTMREVVMKLQEIHARTTGSWRISHQNGPLTSDRWEDAIGKDSDGSKRSDCLADEVRNVLQDHGYEW